MEGELHWGNEYELCIIWDPNMTTSTIISIAVQINSDMPHFWDGNPYF